MLDQINAYVAKGFSFIFYQDFFQQPSIIVSINTDEKPFDTTRVYVGREMEHAFLACEAYLMGKECEA